MPSSHMCLLLSCPCQTRICILWGMPKSLWQEAKFFFLHLRKERRSYILPTRRHLRHFDLPPPMKQRWYRPRNFSVEECSRLTPTYTWCYTLQRRGSVKILFHTYSLILNTYNPPTWALEVNCFFQTPIHLFPNGLRRRAKSTFRSPPPPRGGGGEGEKGWGAYTPSLADIALTQRTFGALIFSSQSVGQFLPPVNCGLYHQEPTLLSLSPVGDLRIFLRCLSDRCLNKFFYCKKSAVRKIL